MKNNIIISHRKEGEFIKIDGKKDKDGFIYLPKKDIAFILSNLLRWNLNFRLK